MSKVKDSKKKASPKKKGPAAKKNSPKKAAAKKTSPKKGASVKKAAPKKTSPGKKVPKKDTKGKSAPAKGASKKAVKKTATKKKEVVKPFRKSHAHLFTSKPLDARIGRDIQPRRDLSRFVRWPRYIRLQRQRAILKKRLKVPPAINQFTHTFDKNQATALFHLLAKYRPETALQKAKRLRETAKLEAENKEVKTFKPLNIKFGLSHVTTLIEERKAKLVVIAHDVDPIELVVWLPSLCRKLDIPYCIVKGKARLGSLVHQKTASVLALTEVRKEHHNELEVVAKAARSMYNDDPDALRRFGGKILGIKRQHIERAREKLAAKEKAALK